LAAITAPRVEAHIFIASLAFLLDRALEKKLKSAGIDLSSKEAWQTRRIQNPLVARPCGFDPSSGTNFIWISLAP
jgi:hypothetical protein